LRGKSKESRGGGGKHTVVGGLTSKLPDTSHPSKKKQWTGGSSQKGKILAGRMLEKRDNPDNLGF